MQCNLGGVDRSVRVVLGLAIIGWGVWAGSWFGALGAVPLLTAVVAFCPAYVPFGLRTCPRPDKG